MDKKASGPKSRQRSVGTDAADRGGIAAMVSTILGWDWLDDGFSVEARRWLPPLMVGLYLADQDGRSLTMRQACDLMGIDYAKTGPRYVRLAEQKGLLTIRERPPEDRRKTLLAPTDALRDLVESQLDMLRERVVRSPSSDALPTHSAAENSDAGVAASLDHPGSGTKKLLEEPVLRVPEDVRPYAQQAAELVEAFHRSEAIRPLLLDRMPPSILLTAQFAADRSRMATLGGPWGVVQEQLPNIGVASALVRALFFLRTTSIKIFPGTHHFGFDAQVHPDDLQAAQSIAVMTRQFVTSQSPQNIPGLFPADNFNGTLLLLGGNTSNALTRLLLEYTFDDEGLAMSRVRDPLVPLRYVYEVDPGRRPLRKVLDLQTGEAFHVESDGRQRLLSDFLMLTVLPNFLSSDSFKRGEKIVIFNGLHGIGTRAGALMLQKFDLLEQVRRSIGTATAWQALIKVDRISYGKRGAVPISLDRNPRVFAMQMPEDPVEIFRRNGGAGRLDGPEAATTRKRGVRN